MGQRMCRPCRAAPPRQGSLLAARRKRRSERWAARERDARQCSTCKATTTGIKRFCEPCRLDRAARHWQRKNAVRRGASPFGPALSIAQLGARDGWRCHLCRGSVDSSLPYQHRMAGTRDHLIPVKDGGDDSPANLRLAHRSCNSRRGAGGTVQLQLVG